MANGIDGVGGAGFDANSMPVDTEMFMAILLAQLEGLDEATRSLMGRLGETVEQRQGLAQTQAQLEFLRARATGGTDRGADTVLFLDDPVSAEDARNAGFTVPEGATEVTYRSLLTDIPSDILPFDSNVNRLGDRDALARSNFQDAIGVVSSRMEAINSTAQLDMLRLNSLISKRQQAFEQTSNIMRRLDDIRSTIINNIR